MFIAEGRERGFTFVLIVTIDTFQSGSQRNNVKKEVYPDRTLSGRCLNTSQWTGICDAPSVLCVMFRWLNFV